MSVSEVSKKSQNEYRRTTKILVTLRRHDHLSWAAIEDNSRRTSDKRGVDNLSVFLDHHFEAFLKPEHYSRCLVQTQPIHVEVAVEKDALATIVENAIWPYCVRLSVLRGQPSATMVNDMSGRFAEAAMRGKTPVLIHLGDLDPSGVAIPKAHGEILFFVRCDGELVYSGNSFDGRDLREFWRGETL